MLEYSESSNHNESMTLQEVLTRHEAVFKEGLGTWTGPPAKIHVNKDAVPRYYKHRPVPYAQKKRGSGVRAVTQKYSFLSRIDVQ